MCIVKVNGVFFECIYKDRCKSIVSNIFILRGDGNIV